MIPNHVLSNLTPDGRVAILARGGEIHFLVHPASDDPDAIRAYAEREGSEVLTTHMRDHAALLEFVAGRERDVGGDAGPDRRPQQPTLPWRSEPNRSMP